MRFRRSSFFRPSPCEPNGHHQSCLYLFSLSFPLSPSFLILTKGATTSLSENGQGAGRLQARRGHRHVSARYIITPHTVGQRPLPSSSSSSSSPHITLCGVRSVVIFCRAFLKCCTGHWADTLQLLWSPMAVAPS